MADEEDWKSKAPSGGKAAGAELARIRRELALAKASIEARIAAGSTIEVGRYDWDPIRREVLSDRRRDNLYGWRFGETPL